MSRTVKTIKDKDNNDIEVYSMNCTVCSKEMVFPKNQADEIEKTFPFIKEKVEAGSPCVECAIKLEETENYKLLSEEEFNMLKAHYENNKTNDTE